MSDGASAPPHPPTRSFQPRRRQVSALRSEVMRRVAPEFSLAVEGPLLDLGQVFDRQAPVVLDIGFGGGEATIELAAAQPERDVVAVEVHTPGIARVFQAIEREGFANVRVVDGDVLDFLPRVPKAAFSEIRVWFPDPWPKARQRRRRLIRPDIVTLLVEYLAPDGHLHLATDIADYAEQMIEVCSANPSLRGGPVPRPEWRPLTRYESRGLAAGRTPVDLIYRRAPA